MTFTFKIPVKGVPYWLVTNNHRKLGRIELIRTRFKFIESKLTMTKEEFDLLFLKLKELNRS